MSEHTPGPWIVTDDAQIGYKPTICNMAGRTHQPGAKYVADVRGPGKEWGCPSIETAANARLIAAAPDLFEACQATQAYEVRRGAGDLDGAEEERLRLLRMSAIVKAGGKP